jgi:15-cis-phytoene synthase
MMQKGNDLRAGFKQARAITKKFAKTFYFASRFLPKEKRLAAYTVYAICRLSDETVDNNAAQNSEAALAKLEHTITQAYSDEPLSETLTLAFRATLRKFSIPKEYFDELLQGMRMDLRKTRYATFEELYAYCYKVAGVVGLIMLHIFGFKNAEAKQHAIELGIAMQLTNILRDIKEDLQRGRIYLPLDEMQRFQICESKLSCGQIDDRLRALLKFQIARAKQYYEAGEKGIPLIEEAKSRLVTRIMSVLYAGILNEIERCDFNVFTQRAHVPFIKKVAYAARVISKGQM